MLHNTFFRKILFFFISLIFTSGVLFSQSLTPYELDKVGFQGNEAFSSAILADVIVSKQTPFWFSKSINKLYDKLGRKASYFDSLLIQEDLQSLDMFYKDNGFFKTKIKYSYKLDETKGKAELTYYIQEGPRFIVKNYKFRGINLLPKELSSKISEFKIDSATHFSKKLLNENNNLLISTLRDNGYMLAKIDLPWVNIDTANNFVNIGINVTPGMQYFIDSLTVEKKGPGKDGIDDDLIIKLAGLKSNECYSAYEKQQAQIRLYRTNLFSSVLISGNIRDTANTQVPLTINADINTLHDLSPELIINNIENSFNFGAGVNYNKKNFFGSARNFSITGNFAINDIFKEQVIKDLPKFFTINNNTYGYVDLRASVEQPYFYDEPIRTRIESYWTMNKNEKYNSFTIGSKLSFDFELPKYVFLSSLNTYYSIEGSVYKFTDETIKEANKKLGLQTDTLKNSDSQWETTSIIGCDIGINKTDNLLFPTRGYNLTFTIEEANLLLEAFNAIGVGSKPKSLFYKLQTTFSYFPALYNSTTSAFGIKLKLGHLQTYAGQRNMIPLNKRFTSGGSNSIRGWGARGLNPEGNYDQNQIRQAIQSNNDIFNNYVMAIPPGGTFLLEGSFESRNRLYDQLGMATFIDYGNNWLGYNKFSLKDIAVAVGFGFRYYSTFAPIRIDFGFKAYDPINKVSIFKKSIGDIFSISDNLSLQLGIGEAF